MDLKLLICSFVLLLVFLCGKAEDKLSTKECEDLGFTGLALCSDCHTFAEYIKDHQELVSDCLKCCAEDSDDGTSKALVGTVPFLFINLYYASSEFNHLAGVIYSGASIEVCMRKLVFYPELVGFIEEDKDKFPNLKVQYAYNSPPKLIMLDDDGNVKETIRIDNWKREHILQFLNEKVKPLTAI